jgi:hypothetical protein
MSFNIEVESGKTVKLPTGGKYCSDDILVTATGGDGGSYEQGVTDGKKAEYEAFWDSYQQQGNKNSYYQAFANGHWNNSTYNPKHPIVCSADANSGQYVFYNFKRLKSTKKPIECRNTSLTYMFRACNDLVEIPLLKLENILDFSNTFHTCNSLTDITIDGDIDKTINFNWSPLSVASMKSVITNLVPYTGDDSAKPTVKFNTDCWSALNADSISPDGESTWQDYVTTVLRWNV